MHALYIHTSLPYKQAYR